MNFAPLSGLIALKISNRFLCGHLSVHRRRHDLGRIGYRRTRRELVYTSAGFLKCRAIDASRGGAGQVCLHNPNLTKRCQDQRTLLP